MHKKEWLEKIERQGRDLKNKIKHSPRLLKKKKGFLWASFLGWGLVVFALVLGVWLQKYFSFQPKPSQVSKPEPEAIVLERASLLKVGFVTDWEYADKIRLKQKITSEAPIELRKVVSYFNTTFLPDVVVGGGDYIESSNAKAERARRQLAEMNAIFSKVTAPRLYAFGDHDFRSLTQEEIKSVLGLAETHDWKDIGDWRIITIDPNYDRDDNHRNAKPYVFGHMSPAEMDWLRGALQTERPALVFSHYNLIPVPNSKGAYIYNVDNADAVRTLLEEAGNVVAVVSGHNPMGYYEKRNGIHYFVVDTLVNRKAMGSFATIEARYIREQNYAHIFLRQYGAYKVQYAVDGKIGKSDTHLITSPPFALQLSDEVTEAELMDQ